MSDAITFATLIDDVFPSVEAATIFQGGMQEQTSASHGTGSKNNQVLDKPAELSIPSKSEEGN